MMLRLGEVYTDKVSGFFAICKESAKKSRATASNDG
jgi:hypothetical protein